jgi:hypothetical protein
MTEIVCLLVPRDAIFLVKVDKINPRWKGATPVERN